LCKFDGYKETDSQEKNQFKAPGNGIITASLKDNPSLQNSINITVQPAQ